ncbi:HEAT repeat domain-containing protein [Lysobacter sp. 1R34A]|uniref:HEAT repeat domain-containing protein n=1 Tax=Lysobacter sp. 1R34A TaxID=3445786 RepID=UPI003EEA45EA
MSHARLGLALLTSALIGGLLGAAITRSWMAPAAPQGGDHASGAPASADTPTRTQHSALADALAGGGPRGRGAEDLDRDVRRASQDPGHLRELLRRYSFETDLDRRGALLAILQGVANDEVLQFGRRLAADPDPQMRRNGLALLKAFPLDRAEVRDTLARQLREERDPALLKESIDMLAPAVVASEDAAPLLERLAALRGHADPEVRASAVLQSARWDKQGDGAAILEPALLDPDLAVRRAAIAGIEASGARSERLKIALLDIAGDAGADADLRRAAAFALQNFALDRDEYALYRDALARADATGRSLPLH